MGQGRVPHHHQHCPGITTETQLAHVHVEAIGAARKGGSGGTRVARVQSKVRCGGLLHVARTPEQLKTWRFLLVLVGV